MKIKGVLMMGAALAVGTFAGSNSVQAAERLSMYDINNFLEKMASAVNNPDTHVGRAFLARSIDSNAKSYNTIRRTWADPRFVHPAWYGNHVSPHYRYPYGYDAYFQPTSVQSIGKTEMIAQFESKKNMIPRYQQSFELLSTRMPADASSATLDIKIKEYGLNYALGPYGAQYGQQLQHSAADCQMQLAKKYREVRLTALTCRTNLHAPG